MWEELQHGFALLVLGLFDPQKLGAEGVGLAPSEFRLVEAGGSQQGVIRQTLAFSQERADQC